MEVRYYLDGDTGLPHIRRHGVLETEVEAVLARPIEDRPGRDGVRLALGRTPAGRWLRVVYVPDSQPGGVFVITAYALVGKPLAALRRRMRRRRL